MEALERDDRWRDMIGVLFCRGLHSAALDALILLLVGREGEGGEEREGGGRVEGVSVGDEGQEEERGGMSERDRQGVNAFLVGMKERGRGRSADERERSQVEETLHEYLEVGGRERSACLRTRPCTTTAISFVSLFILLFIHFVIPRMLES